MSTHQLSARTPERIGQDLKENFAELWESVRERAFHTFDRLHGDDLRGVSTLADLRRVIQRAYLFDDVRLEEEIDRFVNEGGRAAPPRR